MKINNQNTALHFLDERTPLDFFTPPIEGLSAARAASIIYKTFPGMRSKFSQKIQFVSRPFIAAIEKARSKFDTVFLEEPLKQSGTLILPAEQGNTTLFYDFDAIGGRGDWNIECTLIYFISTNMYPRPILYLFVNISGDNQLTYYIPEDFIKGGADYKTYVSDMLAQLLFMKFCELETKIIPGGAKGKHVNEKYVNETKSSVQILDSTWFTTLVKSDAFRVGDETGGFLRLQPCGPQLSERKLIWISPFEKKGYVRKAKIAREE